MPYSLIVLYVLLSNSCSTQIENNSIVQINPNQFKGDDIQRIQSAINAAKGTSNKIVIPSRNANGTNVWLLESAILLPGNMTVILDNCNPATTLAMMQYMMLLLYKQMHYGQAN